MTSPLKLREWNGVTIPAAGTFTLDPAHTRVGFVVKHMMVSKVRGNFGEFEGTITVGEDPLTSGVTATIRTASVNTGQEQRDGHLRTGDFFLVDEHPTMTFTSTGITGHDGTSFTLRGDLTIRGVTRPVDLDVEFEGVALSPHGAEVLGFTATTEVNREDFGLTWNTTLETGGVLLGPKVKIEIEGEAVRA